MVVFSLHLSPSHFLLSVFPRAKIPTRINGKVQRFVQSCHPRGKATQSTTSPVVLTAERMRSGRMKTAFYNLFLSVGYDPEDHYSVMDPVFTRLIAKE